MDSHIILRTSSSDISEEGGRKRSVSSPDTASNLIRKKQNIQNIEPIVLVQTIGEKIPERYGHSAAIDMTRGRMFIFGGCSTNISQFLEDVYYLTFSQKKWEIVPSPLNKIEKTENPSEEMAQEMARIAKIWPRGRHFHTSVSYKGKMYIFGGKSNGYMADIWAFDFGTLEWMEIFPNGNVKITTRYGHSSVIYNDSMYVFGGYDGFGLQCNDLWEFNFPTEEWKRLKTLGVAPERYHHSAVDFEGSMYIWGGHEGGNDLYEYRFGTSMWSIINTKGIAPNPRWGHKAITVRRCMYIFGGCDHLTNFNDIYCFHFDTSRWEKLKMGGEYSQGYFQSAVNYNDRIYIFGGRNVHNYDFNELFEIRLDFDSNSNPNTFTDDFRNILHDNEFSDVLFAFPREGRELTAHRHILYSRCKKFREVIAKVSGIPQNPPTKIVENISQHSSNIIPPSVNKEKEKQKGKKATKTSKQSAASSPAINQTNSEPKKRDRNAIKKKKKKKKDFSQPQLAISESTNETTIIQPQERNENILLRSSNILTQSSNDRIIMIETPNSKIDWNPPSNTNKYIIPIEDISYDNFKRLLEYIYCGTFDVSPIQSFEFLSIANFYELDHLKNLCATKIQRSIDIHNVLYALTLADRCKVADLKQFCLSFIFNNRKEVSPAIKNSDLDSELLKEVKKYLTVHSLEQQFKAKSIYSIKQSH